ncbi:MAG: hypothetical protein AAF267_22740 [Deinococcota bacterium]
MNQDKLTKQMQAITQEAERLGHDVAWQELGDDVWRATCRRCGMTMVVYGSGSVYGYNNLISEACSVPQRDDET